MIVPESATILFGGGFPRSRHADARTGHANGDIWCATRYRRRSSSSFSGTSCCAIGERRGAYWPDGSSDFFRAMGTSLEHELARYDAVVFLKLRRWPDCRLKEEIRSARRSSSRHASSIRPSGCSGLDIFDSYGPHHESFFHKSSVGLSLLRGVVAELQGSPD